MMTPVSNRAAEVNAWIERVHEDDGEVGVIDIRSFVRRRWPGLDEELKERIVREVISSHQASQA